LNQLCAAAAVSPRTLQTGFRRFRNATPMEYLRNYRLTLARTRLQSGPHHYGKNITEIASDCGFSHLSKFAECYRARFNETPSNTLKQGRAKRS
jgi:transcriptional regulator GlxA family with amidase domain